MDIKVSFTLLRIRTSKAKNTVDANGPVFMVETGESRTPLKKTMDTSPQRAHLDRWTIQRVACMVSPNVAAGHFAFSGFCADQFDKVWFGRDLDQATPVTSETHCLQSEDSGPRGKSRF